MPLSREEDENEEMAWWEHIIGFKSALGAILSAVSHFTMWSTLSNGQTAMTDDDAGSHYRAGGAPPRYVFACTGLLELQVAVVTNSLTLLIYLFRASTVFNTVLWPAACACCIDPKRFNKYMQREMKCDCWMICKLPGLCVYSIINGFLVYSYWGIVICGALPTIVVIILWITSIWPFLWFAIVLSIVFYVALGVAPVKIARVLLGRHIDETSLDEETILTLISLITFALTISSVMGTQVYGWLDFAGIDRSYANAMSVLYSSRPSPSDDVTKEVQYFSIWF